MSVLSPALPLQNTPSRAFFFGYSLCGIGIISSLVQVLSWSNGPLSSSLFFGVRFYTNLVFISQSFFLRFSLAHLRGHCSLLYALFFPTLSLVIFPSERCTAAFKIEPQADDLPNPHALTHLFLKSAKPCTACWGFLRDLVFLVHCLGVVHVLSREKEDRIFFFFTCFCSARSFLFVDPLKIMNLLFLFSLDVFISDAPSSPLDFSATPWTRLRSFVCLRLQSILFLWPLTTTNPRRHPTRFNRLYQFIHQVPSQVFAYELELGYLILVDLLFPFVRDHFSPTTYAPPSLTDRGRSPPTPTTFLFGNPYFSAPPSLQKKTFRIQSPPNSLLPLSVALLKNFPFSPQRILHLNIREVSLCEDVFAPNTSLLSLRKFFPLKL